MRYAIISDVHANASALEMALADAREQRVDKIVCLGDVVGYGPDPMAAVELCRKSCDVVLMGNHDAAVAGMIGIRDFIAFAQDGVRRHTAELNAQDKDWLRSLSYVYRDKSILCAHGTPVHPEMFLYMNDTLPVSLSLEWMVRQQRRLLFVGHTHHACCIVLGPDGKVSVRRAEADIEIDRRSTFIVNVGSIGYPRNDHSITYVVYDTADKTAIFRHLPFDLADYAARLTEKGINLPLWLADSLRTRAQRMRDPT